MLLIMAAHCPHHMMLPLQSSNRTQQLLTCIYFIKVKMKGLILFFTVNKIEEKHIMID